jgi:transcriptional regulator with XRE-family HTH domain
MESIGARLKNRRLAKGFTLEDAHKQTRIHISVLKAIEEDSLINISPIYIRGFLKNYCNFLGEDPVKYITDYKESQAPVVVTPRHEEKTASLLKDASLNLAALKPRLKVKVFAAIIIGIVSAIILFNLGKAAVVKINIFLHRSRPAATVATTKLGQKEQQAVAMKNRSALPALNPKQREIVLPVTTASGVKLTIYARDSCSVEVKSDGKVMFKGRLKKGRSESWPAKEKIELYLSNAGVVDLQINSKHISSLGAKGQALKNILITKDSLVVPR